MYAHVIIDNPASQVDMEFDYLVPNHLNIQIGTRVKVPFGNSNRPTLGIVLDLSEDTTFVGPFKEVIEVLDKEPIIDDIQITLAKYIKKETISPISRVLNLMIPEAKRLKTVKYLEVINGDNLDANLLKAFNGLTIVKYTSKFDKFEKSILNAIKNKDLKITYDAVEKKTQKWIKKYVLNINNYSMFYQDVKNEKGRNLLDYLRNESEALTLLEILENVEVSEYTFNKLVRLGFIEEKYELASRIKERTRNVKSINTNIYPYFDKYLNKYKQTEKLLYIPTDKKEELLFLKKVIEENEQNKKNTLIIVPDILRGFEISGYLKKMLNSNICHLNSSFSKDEICEYYEGVINNEYQVVITTPAYALWPYQNTASTVIIDQESKNYRNDQSPRYDLNLVLDKKAELTNTKLIYHSYAPLLDTYKEAMLGHLELLHTKKDLQNKVSIINMMDALRNLESNIISNCLKEKMNKVFLKKEACLLILNNKGYSTSISCRSCGHTEMCPKCKIPLQLNKDKKEMYCPACYHRKPEIKTCPKCFSDKLSLNGFGMEKLEEVVRDIFKDQKVRILKESDYLELEEIIEELDSSELDIIISSDIFSRTINSKRLTLAAIINLDVVLNSPAFDANHMAYAMLEHTSKINDNLELVIQTYSPKHFVLKNFILNNYDEYYFEELNNRKNLRVEPLYEVNRILVGGDYNQVFKVSNNIKKVIQNIVKTDLYIIGPTYNFKEKKVQLIIKHKYKDINKIYMHIYELYQKTNMMIIFDRYSKSIM